MKKTLIALILMVGVNFAQTSGKIIGNGAIWYDSLKTTGVAATSDSVFIVDLNYDYEYPSITIVDTGAVITDSVKLYKGRAVYYNSISAPYDTIWDSNALPVKVDDWSNDTTLVGAGMSKTYIILDGSIRFLKVLGVNKTVVTGRSTKVIIEGIKQK